MTSVKVKLAIDKRNKIEEKYYDLLEKVKTTKQQLDKENANLGTICTHDYYEEVHADGGHGYREYTCRICRYKK